MDFLKFLRPGKGEKSSVVPVPPPPGEEDPLSTLRKQYAEAMSLIEPATASDEASGADTNAGHEEQPEMPTDDPFAAPKECGKTANKIIDVMIALDTADATNMYRFSLNLFLPRNFKGDRNNQSQVKMAVYDPLIEGYIRWRGAEFSTLAEMVRDKAKLARTDPSAKKTALEAIDLFATVQAEHTQKTLAAGSPSRITAVEKRWMIDLRQMLAPLAESPVSKNKINADADRGKPRVRLGW